MLITSIQLICVPCQILYEFTLGNAGFVNAFILGIGFMIKSSMVFHVYDC